MSDRDEGNTDEGVGGTGFDWQRSDSSSDDSSDETSEGSPSDASSGESSVREEYEDPDAYERAYGVSNMPSGADAEERVDTEPDERVEHLESELESLREENTDLESELESLREENTDHEEEIAKLRTALSKEREEFKSYKERAKKRETQAEEAAIAEVIEDMAAVRDPLQRAIEQDDGVDIREGVESTLKNFDDVLAEYDIDLIDPDSGEAPDANRHEVMMKDTFDDIDEGCIASVFSVGYERDERVLKPAQVIVSSGPDDD